MLDLLTLADVLDSGLYEQCVGLLMENDDERCALGVTMETVFHDQWVSHHMHDGNIFMVCSWRCLPYAEVTDEVTLEMQMDHPETVALVRGRGERLGIDCLNNENHSFEWLAEAIRKGVITVEYETPYPLIDLTFDGPGVRCRAELDLDTSAHALVVVADAPVLVEH